MGEAKECVLPDPSGGVAGEAVVEHVDQANPSMSLEGAIHRRHSDRVVICRFDLPDCLESHDTFGKSFDQLDHRVQFAHTRPGPVAYGASSLIPIG